MTTKGGLSEDFKSCLRHFVYYYVNGTLQHVIGDESILKNIDYRQTLMTEASFLETAFAIYSNNIEMDEKGKVTSHPRAMRRAAQYIRSVCDGTYVVEPEFEDWEIELY